MKTNLTKIPNRKRNAEKGDERILKRSKHSTSEETRVQEIDCIPQWKDHEILSDQLNLGPDVAKNIIKLFEQGNTVPFIARYRKNVTNNMTPEELRVVKESCEEITVLKNKIASVVKSLHKSNVLDESLKYNITASRSLEELEYVYLPFKSGSKRTLAERAKELGLEKAASDLFYNKCHIKLTDFVVEEKEDISSVAAVEKGIVHIISSFIATDAEIMSSLRELKKKANFLIQTKKCKPKVSKSNNKSESRTLDEHKFDNYQDFQTSVNSIKPHQVLAINRGETMKILSIKVIVPDSFFHEFSRLCFNKWLKNKETNQLRKKLITQAIEDSYKRLVEPLIKREIRSELKRKAERASCEVFSANLKHLLLATPIKGKPILGIDPGYTHGCKLALISPMGNLLISDTIYPHKKDKYKNTEQDEVVLRRLLIDHNCELIALGNGTACRQTEEWLTKLIEKNFFQPLDVRYTVVREDGASIYSCGVDAKKEFPDLSPNIISAVSLARRVQNPLAELVKVEPKHLGIGMYQHDIKKKILDEALNDVVSECVSFVGVDLNTASHCLLRHVAGLTEKKAQEIIDYRNKNGPFVCRQQLVEVNGIGQKVFLQCAGFLRVGPLTNKESKDFYKNQKTTKLDCTNIHPESYDIAVKVIRRLNLKLGDLGEEFFINTVKSKMLELNLIELKNELKSDEQTICLILDTLSKSLNYDLRHECPKEPIFKRAFTSIQKLNVGSILTGVVSNTTHFGCFVDIGVEVNGLIHVSKYSGLNLQIGDKIEIKVLSVESAKKRIGLQALKKLA